jgi:hypothetical protein
MQVHNLQTTRRDQSQGNPDPVVVLAMTPTEPLLALEAEWRGLLAEQAATHKQKRSICDTQCLEAEICMNDPNDRTNEVGDKLTEIEDEILETPPATLDGVRIKLAVLAHVVVTNRHSDFHGKVEPLEDWDCEDRALYDLHLDATRLIGGAAS